VSSDGGVTFSSNELLVQPSQSDANTIGAQVCQLPNGPGLFAGDDYFDYTGLAFYGGHLYAGWADNSDRLGGNPDISCGMDIYLAKVQY
jgi:hypothetical protein